MSDTKPLVEPVPSNSYDSVHQGSTQELCQPCQMGTLLPSDYVNIKYATHLIQEGENDEEPCKRLDKYSLLAYAIFHHWLYYWSSFIAVLVLMLLAFWEQAAVPSNEDRPLEEKAIYISIEMVLLLFIGVNLILRFVWRGYRNFFMSRNILVTVVLLVMFLETAILFKNHRHFRITRALRPLLLLDTYLMAGARRVVRQICKCAKYIIDVILVLFFLTALASLIGFFLFSTINSTYYETLPLSFVSTFIALTTANDPDVFLEAYKKVAASPVFFVIFFIIASYCLINLLAVVVVKYRDEAEQKYKTLFFRRKSAIHEAYEKLVSGEKKGLTFELFLGLMHNYKPGLAEYEVMCIYHDLQKKPDCSRGLTVSEFEHLYQCLGLRWEITDIDTGKVLAWYMYYDVPRVQTIMKKMHWLINYWLFKFFMTSVVIGNLLLLIVPQAQFPELSCSDKHFCVAQSFGVMLGSFLFTLVYVTEVTIRLLLEGGRRYLRKWWNWFDLIIVYGSFICLCVEVILRLDIQHESDWPKYLVIVRPLILIRILRLRRSYFHLVKTMSALAFRLISICFLILCVFYSSAIVGMEVFGGDNSTVYPGCCQNASYDVGMFYNANNTGDTPNMYWLNNFTTLYSSFVTLYELLVVNNWFIIMEGFVTTTSWAARIYFILFWIIITVILNVSTGYILEGFELFLTDLANKQIVIENHVINGLRKYVYVRLTWKDKQWLEKCTPQQTSMKTLHWIRAISLWWKRRTFNKQNWDKSLRIRILRGEKSLSESEIGSLKYKDKLQEWREEWREEWIDNMTSPIMSVNINTRDDSPRDYKALLDKCVPELTIRMKIFHQIKSFKQWCKGREKVVALAEYIFAG